jgi:hypothetical protein
VREGYSGSFFTGALVTLVASPCTAPFMAAAMDYAISWTKKLMPVALPPGRARLATRPARPGLGRHTEDDRDRRAAGVLLGVAITATRRQSRSATRGGTRTAVIMKVHEFDDLTSCQVTNDSAAEIHLEGGRRWSKGESP